MSAYHFSTKLIQRSKGQNAVAAAAYYHAAKMHADKQGNTFDYSHKQNVIFGEILLPDDAPEWIKNLNPVSNTLNHRTNSSSLASHDKEIAAQFSEKLWNMIEDFEVRKDAQLARNLDFSLPKELTSEKSIILVRRFLKEQVCTQGVVTDWSFHNNDGNLYARVLMTLRSLTSNGFGEKIHTFGTKSFTRTLHEKWVAYIS